MRTVLGLRTPKHKLSLNYKLKTTVLNNNLSNKAKLSTTCKPKRAASEEVKQQLTDLQAKFEAYKTDSEANLAKVTKSNAIRLALKDVDAHNSDDLAKFINFDEIELDESGKPKLDKVIKGLKETSPYLFKQEEQAAQPKIFAGGNPSASQNGITKEDFKRMGINERQELF